MPVRRGRHAPAEQIFLRIMLSGAMPRWRQYFYVIACGFILLIFVAFGVLGGRFYFRFAGTGNARSVLIPYLLFGALAIVSIGMQIWYLRRLISEFTFDGRALQFRTLGASVTQTRDVSQIADVQDWRGR